MDEDPTPTSALRSPCTSAPSGLEWGDAVQRLRLRALCIAMPIMGIPERHRSVIEDSAAGGFVCFQAFALLLSSMAFGATTYMYSSELLRNPWWTSFILAAVAVLVLFPLDRQTLIALRLAPHEGNVKRWIVRVITVFMTVMMALVAGVKAHSVEIDANLEQMKIALEKKIAERPMYADYIEEYDADIEQLDGYSDTLDEIDKVITEKRNNEFLLSVQCNGSVDPGNHIKAVRGCSAGDPISDGLNAKIAELKDKLTQLTEKLPESTTSETIRQARATAMENKRKVGEKVSAEASGLVKGSGARIGELFSLIWHGQGSLFPVFFGFALTLLPEIMLLFAMTRSSMLQQAYDVLNELEHERVRALALQMARHMKIEIATKAAPVTKSQASANMHRSNWRDAVST